MCLGDVAMSVARDDVSSSDSDFNMTYPHRINNENLEPSRIVLPPASTAHSFSQANATSPNDRCTQPMISSGNGEVIAMLQQQQAVLQEVLKGQEVLKTQQAEMEEKISTLEAEVNKPADLSMSPSSSSDGKRKRVVTKALSVSQCVC